MLTTIIKKCTSQCWNEYLFWDESNIEYYSSDENWTNRISNIIRSSRKYSNIIRIPENIRIYSNKFAKNVKVLESKIFTYPEKTFQSERIFHILTLNHKKYRSSPCSQNIVQILSLFLKIVELRVPSRLRIPA